MLRPGVAAVSSIVSPPMYEEFYGFVQPPFTLAPDPRFLYRSESHEDAIRQLLLAVRRREGFIVLAGDIGTGKTTLCRALLQQLEPTTFTSLILNPFMSVEELIREMLLDFGVVSRDAVRSGKLANASKHELIGTLHEFLLSLIAIGGSGVLIIDEAQHLSPDVLEQIRVISNLETNESKLLQIVLVGQLNLLDVIGSQQMRQLDQRVSLRAMLKPLTRDEVEAYVAHRLAVANGASAIVFDRGAVDLVHQLSSGVPRVINLLCDRALMVGAEARQTDITPEIVRAAAARLDYALPAAAGDTRPRRVGKAIGLAAAILIMAAAVLVLAPPDRLIEVTTPETPAAPDLTVPVPLDRPPAGVPNVVIPLPPDL